MFKFFSLYAWQHTQNEGCWNRGAKKNVSLICCMGALPLALWGIDVNALDDPTKPSYDQMMVEKSSDGLLPKVSSIMISSKGRQAMIDGRMLKVGDWVGDFEVLSIDSNRVKLRREEQVFEVKLVSGFFKKQNKD